MLQRHTLCLPCFLSGVGAAPCGRPCPWAPSPKELSPQATEDSHFCNVGNRTYKSSVRLRLPPPLEKEASRLEVHMRYIRRTS